MSETTAIQQAVKEALDDKKLMDIGFQLVALSTQMSEGFARVHLRQDVANGKVMTNTEAIAKIKGKAVYDKITWALITTLFSVVVFFITRG